jgi:protein involved in sex pheromone biosynthesis
MKKLLVIGLIASSLILGGCFKEEKMAVPEVQKQVSENTQS